MALIVACMEPGKAFGIALRQRRVEARLTQEALALEAGVGRVFVSWLESGKKQPTLQTILKLAAVLNCRASELVEDTEAMLGQQE